MSETMLVVVAGILAVAWVPVGIYFFKSWKNRRSPLSLAICGLIGFPIYTNLSTALFMDSSSKWVCLVLVVANLVLWSNFMFCFYWQKKSFPDVRSRKPSEDN
jgi:hypothetical protein